jgi:ATP-dependent helicase HrpA
MVLLDPAALAAQLAVCMRADRHRLEGRLRAAEARLRRNQPADHMLQAIAREIEQSSQRRALRAANRPKPTYPDALPVVERRQVIAEAITGHQVIVLCGETGSGKTTQLPKICLDVGRGIDGLIGHTQPRRIAARSVATRIAQELAAPLGEAVGYKVRFGDHTSADTYIKLMTDGILLAETQGDRLLEQYDTIIIDEAHERSLNIDFLIGYLHQLLPKRPDLKVIITSATIDPLRFSKHFNNAPIIEVSGRTYPVETRYRPLMSDDPEEEDVHQLDGILGAVDELCREGLGDVLVFLSGEREIREAAEALRKHHPPATEILPLYARLSADEQMRVFQPHGRRRIVLATNVAETSLTVPGIRYVVDTGYARVSRYTPRSKVQRLPIECISQASADQRKGRCGRVEAGICIRLYSQEDFESRPAFTEPEILRTNLASVILQMKALQLGDIQKFPFVEPPDYQQIKDGYHTLLELGAVDERHELTAVGRQLSRLPVDPRIGRMILSAVDENCMEEVLVIAAALSVQDPRDRPMDQQEKADAAHGRFKDEGSDFISILKLWKFFRKQQNHLSHSKFRRMCRENFLSYTRLREWEDIYHQLHETAGDLGIHARVHGHKGTGRLSDQSAEEDEFPSPLRDSIHRALLAGLLGNIGQKGEQAEYNGTRGSKFFIFPGSSQFSRKPQWVMAAELVETTRLYARTVAPIRPEWVERLATHLIHRSYVEPHWQPDTGHVAAYEKVTLYGLVLVPRRLVHYGPIDPIRSRQLFIQHCLVEGGSRLDAPFFRANRRLIEEVQALEAKLRTRDVLVDEQVRYDFYDSRIPVGIYNIPLFEKWRKQAERDDPKLLLMTRRDLMLHGAEDATAERFPDAMEINGQRFPLSYKLDSAAADDGVTVTIPLAALNKLPGEPFEWLVPGWLPEKITELMRTLPKALRTKFVPIPDTARAVARAMPFAYGPLLDRLAQQLSKLGGMNLSVRDFDQVDLPANMRMNFRIVDEKDVEIAVGRDLAALRKQLGIAAAASFATLSTGQFHRDGLARWDFGDLPLHVEVRRGEATLLGYPALVDNGQSVSLRLLDSPEAQRASMRAGLRRLFMLQLSSEMKQLARMIPDIEKMGLHYSTIGPGSQLKEDLLAAIADRALLEDASPMSIRTQADFAQRAGEGWKHLSAAMREIVEPVKSALAIYAELNPRLQKTFPPAMSDSVRDMTEQLRWLFMPHFVLRMPWTWLRHYPRFARGIEVRLKKMLDAGLARDMAALTQVQPYWRRYVEQARRDAEKGRADAELETYRWMVEEFRVSLFAQDLKTSQPISAKRLDGQWEKILR